MKVKTKVGDESNCLTKIQRMEEFLNNYENLKINKDSKDYSEQIDILRNFLVENNQDRTIMLLASRIETSWSDQEIYSFLNDFIINVVNSHQRDYNISRISGINVEHPLFVNGDPISLICGINLLVNLRNSQ